MPFWAALRTEIQRLQDKPFLEAAMAICALSAMARGRVTLAERYQVDTLLATLDRLAVYDPHEAIAILNDFVFQLQEDPGSGAGLRGKIHRYAGDSDAAQALLRMAYLVMTADGSIGAAERETFDELCGLLAVEPTAVLAVLARSGEAAPSTP